MKLLTRHKRYGKQVNLAIVAPLHFYICVSETFPTKAKI